VTHEISTATISTSTSPAESGPSSSIGVGSACVSEGFFPTPGDCKKFHRCVDNGKGAFTKYDFICGKGTVWDPTNNVCNHESAVQRNCNAGAKPGDVDQGSGGQINPSGSNASTSTTPDQGTATPGGGSSNTVNGQEGSPINTQGNLSPGDGQGSSTSPEVSTLPEHGQGSSTAIDGQGGSPAVGGQESSNTSESQISSGVATAPCSEQATPAPLDVNITCPRAGFFGHPIICNIFYRCVDWDGTGERFSVFFFTCVEGTIFDPSLAVCNYPEVVYPIRNCSLRISESSEKPSSTQQTTEVTKPAGSSTSESSTETTDAEAPELNLSTIEGRPTTATPTGPPETTLTSQETPNTATITDGVTGTTHEETTGTSGVTDAPTITTNQETAGTAITATEGAATTTNEENPDTAGSTDLTSTTVHPNEEPSNPPETTNTGTTNPTEGNTVTSESTGGTESTNTGISEATPIPEIGPSTETHGEAGVTTTEGTAVPEGSEGHCPDVGALDQDQIAVVCPTGFKRHPKYCDLFYQCTVSGHEMNILVLACVNGTVFDEENIQCLPPEKARYCKGTMADGRLNRNIDDSSESLPVSLCIGRASMEAYHK
jgi:hypothetical protein